jgi:2',3'-cyclic-nucleotide 2'-phosphodiesterase (5'-nucleotidase family)
MWVCTAGDFYGTADVFNETKSHFVAEMMGVLGYDAIGIGEMDLNFGLASLARDARKVSPADRVRKPACAR